MCSVIRKYLEPDLDAKVTTFLPISDERWNISSPEIFTYCCLPSVNDPGGQIILLQSYTSSESSKRYVSHVKCDILRDTFLTCKVKRCARDVKSEKVGHWALIWSLREVAAPSPYSQEGRNASHIIIVIIILLPSCCDDLMIISKLTEMFM